MIIELKTLEADLLRIVTPNQWRIVGSMQIADGVMFLCPKCVRGAAKGKQRGVHSIVVWFDRQGVPANMVPLGRHFAVGASLDDLSLTSEVGSYLDTCSWKGYIRKGEVYDK